MKASSYFPDIPPRRIKPVMAYLHDKTILQLHHSGIMAKQSEHILDLITDDALVIGT